MNIYKVQMEIIKAHEKLKKDGRSCLVWDDGDHVLLGTAYQIFRIPKEECLLDIRKLRSMEYLRDCADPLHHVDAVKTGQIARMDRLTLVKFRSEEKNISCWVNEKLLTIYGKEEDLRYQVSAWSAPVLIYKGDEMIGAVLPVKYKEEE